MVVGRPDTGAQLQPPSLDPHDIALGDDLVLLPALERDREHNVGSHRIGNDFVGVEVSPLRPATASVIAPVETSSGCGPERRVPPRPVFEIGNLHAVRIGLRSTYRPVHPLSWLLRSPRTLLRSRRRLRFGRLCSDPPRRDPTGCLRHRIDSNGALHRLSGRGHRPSTAFRPGELPPHRSCADQRGRRRRPSADRRTSVSASFFLRRSCVRRHPSRTRRWSLIAPNGELEFALNSLRHQTPVDPIPPEPTKKRRSLVTTYSRPDFELDRTNESIAPPGPSRNRPGHGNSP